MSRIAVPVVSEPVPAVVGMAMRGSRAFEMGSPFPTGALMKSNRSASLYTENLFKGVHVERCHSSKMHQQVRSLGRVNDTSSSDTVDVLRVRRQQVA